MQTYTDTEGRVWNILSRRWITLSCNADDVITTIETCAVVAPEGFDEATKELVISEKIEPAQAATIESALAWEPRKAVDKLMRKKPIKDQPVEKTDTIIEGDKS